MKVCGTDTTALEDALMRRMGEALEEPMRVSIHVRRCEELVERTRCYAPGIPIGRALQLASEVIARRRSAQTKGASR